MRLSRIEPLALATFLATVLAACGIIDRPPSASAACVRAAQDHGGLMVGAFATTVGAVRALEPVGQAPARFPGIAADEAAVLCYIDATIPMAPPPGPDGEIQPPFDRAVVAIVRGESEMVLAGYRTLLPVRAP